MGEAEAERDSWSRLTCIVVRKRDMTRALRILGDALMMDSLALPSAEFYRGHHYFGEYPSWAVEHFADWEAVGRRATGPALRARATVVDYTCERGNFDYSIEETINVTLPAPRLIAALGLHLSDGRRSTYVDDHNGIIFFDPSLSQPGPQAGLVAREPFLTALEREGLAAVWVIAGEKNVYGETDSRPTREALVDRLVLAVALGHVRPVGARPQNPKHGIDEIAVIDPGAPRIGDLAG